MSDSARCPHCECPLPDPAQTVAVEIDRIRRLAESQDSHRVQELTAQVRELQQTVARLRAHAAAGYR
ncbi:hypothetical protein [Amycolatopsis pigmentata]|uniref:Uncharacterized protein n=1 Tax=Amycolatopsis pigmentata TaxID=450801 RepID=A0ABW5GA88_9PSEU